MGEVNFDNHHRNYTQLITMEWVITSISHQTTEQRVKIANR